MTRDQKHARRAVSINRFLMCSLLFIVYSPDNHVSSYALYNLCNG